MEILRPRIFSISRAALLEQIFAFEDQLAAGNPGRRRGYEAQDRERGHAFAAAGFADDAEGFTLRDRQRKILDRRQHAALEVKIDREIFNIEERRRHLDFLFLFS